MSNTNTLAAYCDRKAETADTASAGIWRTIATELRANAAELGRLRRHGDIAAGLLDVPHDQRGAAWHLEVDGVLATLAKATLVTPPAA